jgi:hypothetical protein
MTSNLCRDCHTSEMPSPRHQRCVKCGIVHEAKMIKARNDRNNAKAIANRKPRTCKKCNEPPDGKSQLCKAHKAEAAKAAKERQRENDKAYKQRIRDEQGEAEPPPTPTRAEPAIVKTSAQVDAECRREEARLRTVRDRLNPDLLNQRLLRWAFR